MIIMFNLIDINQQNHNKYQRDLSKQSTIAELLICRYLLAL